MFAATPETLPFWQLFTRLGEAQILLPAALLAALLMRRRPGGGRLAAWWLGTLAVAVIMTTASKLAFIGWGLGSAALDFTGISGHSMFAAAIYPVLLGTVAPADAPGWRRRMVGLGVLLALGVGLSRLIVHAHSPSEVVAGLGLGFAVSALAILHGSRSALQLRPWAPALLALWLVAMPSVAPPSQSHSIVTRLALRLSGHERPYTRAALHRLRPTPAAEGSTAAD